MSGNELIYDYPSIVITLTLFACIVACNELGFRLGRFVQDRTDQEMKSLTGAIQASILGLLALLLGFTFNMSMQRYDARNQALIVETSAIGHALRRAQLLAEPGRDAARGKLREYIELRIEVGDIDLTEREQRSEFHRRTSRLQGDLWELAAEVTDTEPRPVTAAAFASALADMFAAENRRSALLQMHVPEVVLLLLFVVFMASGAILGYSSGLSGKRVVAPSLMVALLICLVVFIVIDLDRPKRGLIQVDRSSLLELRSAIP